MNHFPFLEDIQALYNRKITKIKNTLFAVGKGRDSFLILLKALIFSIFHSLYMSNTSATAVPNIGDNAPDFELPDINMQMQKLSDYIGKEIVLAFFPAAESPICTKEMCAFRDSLDELKHYGAQVIGVSVDGPFANKIFTENRHLNFPVLSDYKREVINKYGILMKNLGPLEDYNAAKRSVFIIDRNGKVQYKWVSDNPLIEPNYQEVKEALKTKNL